MSRTFTKLFSSITESTIWCESDQTRIVWIAMLAMADSHGRVWSSIPGLANRARVPMDAVEEALDTFMSPDPYSRTPEHEGRRIEKLECGGGWRLLNHAKYRAIRDEESIKESKRRYINERRAAEKAEGVEKCRTVSNAVDRSRANAEADTEAEKSKDIQPDGCPHQQIVDLYHELLPANPRIKVWNGKRQNALRARWREDEKRQNLEYWRRFFAHVASSPFLTGQRSGREGRPFLPGLDWLVLPENFAKVIEGRYHERELAL